VAFYVQFRGTFKAFKPASERKSQQLQWFVGGYFFHFEIEKENRTKGDKEKKEQSERD